MRKFGLIGYPLGHSFSKKYFSEKFEKEEITDCSYDNYPLSSIGQLHDLLKSDPEIIGLNVTIPYKTSVIKIIDSIDYESEKVGAVNVLKIKRTEGKIKISGFNSDIYGIQITLMPFLSESLKNALVLGTGGSSKAVCHVLNKISVKYTLISRTKKPGCLTYSELSKDILMNNQLIINTTPLGMYPDILTRPDLRYDDLKEGMILFDLVYNPEMTSFLKEGKERGCTVINGLKMLYAQAERSWDIWNDDNL